MYSNLERRQRESLHVAENRAEYVADNDPALPALANGVTLHGFERLIQKIVEVQVKAVLAAANIGHSVDATKAGNATAPTDALAAARARGAATMRAELERSDNLTLEGAAALSGMSTRHINQLRNEGKLYALVLEGHSRGFRYPEWQFHAQHARLATVLGALHARKLHCWTIHDFLTKPSDHLGRAPRDGILDPEVPVENILQAVEGRFGDADQGAL